MRILIALMSLISATNIYAVPARVVEVDNELVTFVDEKENYWQCYGYAEKGEEVTLILNSCGTPQVEDDILVNFN